MRWLSLLIPVALIVTGCATAPKVTGDVPQPLAPGGMIFQPGTFDNPAQSA